MRISEFTCRTVRMGTVAACLVGPWLALEARGLTPPVLALAYGLGGTPTPTPVATPTPTPTPSPTPEPAAPGTYRFPVENSFVSIVLPTGWTATADRGGRLLCTPKDPATGYSVALATAGNFSGPEAAKSYLTTLVKETLSGAKISAPKPSPLQTGPLSSGVNCLIQVVDGKLGSVPTSYVFMCFAPVEGRYIVLIAQGRLDKIHGPGSEVVGAMADSVKPL